MTDRPSSAGAPRRSKPWPHRRWLGWLVLGALILLAGAQFDFSRRAETLFTLLLVPALATLLGIVDLWKTRGALRAAALAVQLLAARQRIRTYVTVGVGITAVFALFARSSFDPFHPGGSALSALFVAVIIGGGAGLGCRMVAEQLRPGRQGSFGPGRFTGRT